MQVSIPRLAHLQWQCPSHRCHSAGACKRGPLHLHCALLIEELLKALLLQLLMLNRVCCACSIDACSLLHACVSPAAICSGIEMHARRRQGPTRTSYRFKHMGCAPARSSMCEAASVDRCPSGA